MPKGTLTLPDGTRVSIEGSPEEIARIMVLYSSHSESKRTPSREHEKPDAATPKKPTSHSKPNAKKGPQGHIADLAAAGFFKQKRTLGEVQRKLEEGGHIYAQTSLSAPLLRLVRQHTLRRLQEKDGWVYVNS